MACLGKCAGEECGGGWDVAERQVNLGEHRHGERVRGGEVHERAGRAGHRETPREGKQRRGGPLGGAQPAGGLEQQQPCRGPRQQQLAALSLQALKRPRVVERGGTASERAPQSWPHAHTRRIQREREREMHARTQAHARIPIGTHLQEPDGGGGAAVGSELERGASESCDLRRRQAHPHRRARAHAAVSVRVVAVGVVAVGVGPGVRARGKVVVHGHERLSRQRPLGLGPLGHGAQRSGEEECGGRRRPVGCEGRGGKGLLERREDQSRARYRRPVGLGPGPCACAASCAHGGAQELQLPEGTEGHRGRTRRSGVNSRGNARLRALACACLRLFACGASPVPYLERRRPLKRRRHIARARRLLVRPQRRRHPQRRKPSAALSPNDAGPRELPRRAQVPIRVCAEKGHAWAAWAVGAHGGRGKGGGQGTRGASHKLCDIAVSTCKRAARRA